MQMCNRSIVFLKEFLAAIMDILILKSNRVLMMNQVKCQQQARWRWSYEDGHIENVQEIKWRCLPMPTNTPPSGEDVMISLFIISFMFNIRTPNCVLLEKASANNGWWSISRHMYKSIQDRHCSWRYRRNVGGEKKRAWFSIEAHLKIEIAFKKFAHTHHCSDDMYTLYKQRQQQWGGRTSTQITRLTEDYKQTMETGDLLSIPGTTITILLYCFCAIWKFLLVTFHRHFFNMVACS